MTPEDQILEALTSFDAPTEVRRAVEGLDAYDTSRLRDLLQSSLAEFRKAVNRSGGGEGEQEIG